MKKLISGLVMMLAVAFSVTAQDTTKHKGNRQHKSQYEKVQLTDAQKTELKDLKAGYKQQSEAIRSNATLTDAQKKEQRMELMKKRKADMDRILTADQKKQMAATRKNHKKGDGRKSDAKSEGKKSDRKFGKKGDSPMKDLELTEAQSAKVKTINTEYRAKMMELKKNKATEKTEQKEAFAKLRKQHQEEIRQVLTAEQIQKLETRKKQKTTR